MDRRRALQNQHTTIFGTFGSSFVTYDSIVPSWERMHTVFNTEEGNQWKCFGQKEVLRLPKNRYV